MDAWSPVTDDYGPWHNDFTGTFTLKHYGTFGVTRTGRASRPAARPRRMFLGDVRR